MKRNKANIKNWMWRALSSMILLPILIIASCTEDVLEKTPIDSYSDAAVWDDEALVEAFVNTAYKDLPFGFQNEHGWRFLPYANMSDETNSRNSATNIQINIEGNSSPAYLGPMDVWTGPTDWTYWLPISQANMFLDKIPTSTIDEELKSRLIAEMRSIRAYSY